MNARNIRRVVTGTNSAGRSTIISDGPSPTVVGGPAFTAVQAWRVESTPADLGPAETAETGRVNMNPPRAGAVCWVCYIEPDSAWRSGAAGTGAEAFADASGGADPMHVTDAVDFVQVISGEVYAVLEETETLLGPGDVLIQRGTPHAWSNRSTEVCILACVAIGADPASRRQEAG
ncbi:cupin domain-containing protein [Spongiactinospora sp. 9N601]|uniref:cupin domain-containing protein n=1 Tax=Spongiactinospora sp. 9N601 TaxID=3375149 RepID=UPI00379A8301